MADRSDRPHERRGRGTQAKQQASEELAILQRARGSQRLRAAGSKAEPAPVPYPQASIRTLNLLGTIDALLKAPPQPPRWALLRILSMLEEERAGGVSGRPATPSTSSLSSQSSSVNRWF